MNNLVLKSRSLPNVYLIEQMGTKHCINHPAAPAVCLTSSVTVMQSQSQTSCRTSQHMWNCIKAFWKGITFKVLLLRQRFPNEKQWDTHKGRRREVRPWCDPLASRPERVCWMSLFWTGRCGRLQLPGRRQTGLSEETPVLFPTGRGRGDAAGHQHQLTRITWQTDTQTIISPL